MKHPIGPAMAGLLADRRPGCCAACDEPLARVRPNGRAPVVHQVLACLRVWHLAYDADRRARNRAKVTPAQAMAKRFEAVPRPHRRKFSKPTRAKR